MFLSPTKLSLARSTELEGRVNDSNITVHNDNCLRDLSCPRVCLPSSNNTVFTSQVFVYLGNWGGNEMPLSLISTPVDAVQQMFHQLVHVYLTCMSPMNGIDMLYDIAVLGN